MSDEPTNIIRRPKPAAKSEQPGRNAAGTIRFSCSNGHAIVVPSKLAGKRGACSRCGVPVVIPLKSDQEPANVQPEEVGPAAAGKPAESIEVPQGVAEPTIEEAVETTPGTSDASVDVPDFSGIGGASGVAEGELNQSVDAFDELAGAVSEPASPAFEGIEAEATPEINGVDNPTAVLVAKLFGETEHGGVVELHLKSGQIVMPLLYDFNWSRGTHGVFAAENTSDKTITLMAVAWDSVEQVIIRKVRGLPDGMFE